MRERMTADELENRLNELRQLEETLTNEIEELKEDIALAKANNLIAAAMGKRGRESQAKIKGPADEINKTVDIAVSNKKKYEKLKKEKIEKEKKLAIVSSQICAAEATIPIVEQAEADGVLE